MLLRKTIQKTKILFHKTLQNLKSFLFGAYQKLHKDRPLNHFCSKNSSPTTQQLELFYTDFSEHLDSDHDKTTKRKKKKKKNKKNVILAKELMKEEEACNSCCIKLEEHSVVNIKNEVRGEEEKKMGSSMREKRGESSSRSMNSGNYVLAQKMKELEMMDVNDVDHVLDVEEVLHYYSLLKSPVYLDIMDKFFTDTYSDLFVPQPSASVNNSMRKLGPLKLQSANNSMRKLGPLKLQSANNSMRNLGPLKF
ncbi:uncharacterized protein LOC132285406 [Cornus florida]|uniref:uncharacterized protein LOC132285406 n=1 Tax=Cornus florida TaxID=4283 RepID=UPI00289C3FF8|nr:uncharacterized protein LOC132285406 [Cornus florida]